MVNNMKFYIEFDSPFSDGKIKSDPETFWRALKSYRHFNSNWSYRLGRARLKIVK